MDLLQQDNPRFGSPRMVHQGCPFHYTDLAYGFGYDSVGDDYKVSLAAYRRYDPIPEDRVPKVHIFSLKTDSWKLMENLSRDLQLIQEGDTGLYLNGALHWESCSGKKIVAFDLVEQKFYDVPAPVRGRSSAHELGNCR
ncbi:hypothetical protein Tsubulata_006871 [Turnera subulata]|uniref:F-box associated beta-propeller type 1 domain-containing protein n=1 Tax=Turnera subulata TaxID=218843 RepID=A0A9Q0GB41_9ROSI|nr:hypothetical protein Tsubulata_006871 [Turnera subulata]